jgi:hypothetical protein
MHARVSVFPNVECVTHSYPKVKMAQSANSDRDLRLLISYSHADRSYFEQLRKHLFPLLKRERIRLNAKELLHGVEWVGDQTALFQRADIILLLVSADFLVSSFTFDQVIPLALRKAQEGSARVFPVIIRPAAWESTPLSLLQALPRGGRAVSSWTSPDEAWREVADALYSVTQEIRRPAISEAAAIPLPIGSHGLALYEVFKPSGVPGVTFIEPQQFFNLKLSLAQPGRGVVIEGPSGIGKTTALKKALESLSRGNYEPETVVVYSARKPADLDKILRLQQDHRGIVAIDDFHRLGEETRKEIVDYLKYLADEEADDRKLIIVGIPRTGDRLVSLSFDLATRIDVYKFGRVDNDAVSQMIERGEKALNIRFSRKSDIVRAASGSLNIGQMLCFQLCAMQGIDRTQSKTATMQADLLGAISRVREQVGPKFADMIRFLSSLGGRRDFSAIEILKELAQSLDGFLSFVDLEISRPDLVTAARRFVDQKYMEQLYQRKPSAENHLLYDSEVPALVIDDPQLTFYLAQTPESMLRRDAGKTETAKRDSVFVSYSHRDARWLDRLRVHLRPLEREGKVKAWDDTRIKSGSRWRDEIRAAIDESLVAVLLVSADFLASDFVAEQELPPLLKAAQDDGALILPVIVSPSRFGAYADLNDFQAINPPDHPLSSMDYNAQEEIFVTLTERIEEIFDGTIA